MITYKNKTIIEYLLDTLDRCKQEELFSFQEIDALKSGVDLIVAPWNYVINETPLCSSIVSPDNSPLEIQLSLSQLSTRLRLLFEVTLKTMDEKKNITFSIIQRLKNNSQLYMRFLDSIWHFIAPEETKAPGYILFHLTTKNEVPVFRFYITVDSYGWQNSCDTTLMILDKFGFKNYKSFLNSVYFRGELDKIIGIGVDISENSANCNIYCRHYETNMHDLKYFLSFSSDNTLKQIDSFFMHYLVKNKLPRQPLTSSITLNKSSSPLISTSAIHLPLWLDFENDQNIYDKTCNLLDFYQLSKEKYSKLVNIIARRKLDRASGLHSYVSFRYTSKPQVNLYFSPELYASNVGMCYERTS